VFVQGDSYSYRDFLVIAHYELVSEQIQTRGSVQEKVIFTVHFCFCFYKDLFVTSYIREMTYDDDDDKCRVCVLLVTTVSRTKRLNQSRCHLGFELESQRTMFLVGVRISCQENGHFWWGRSIGNIWRAIHILILILKVTAAMWPFALIITTATC